MARHLASRCLAVAVALATAAGCALPGGTPGPVATPKKSTKPQTAPSAPAGSAKPGILAANAPISAGAPRVVPQAGAVASLTGKVKLLSDHGGALLGNNGATVISNNTGSLISDRGGALISDRGGALVANNSAGLTGKAKFGLLQAEPAAPAAESLLADAIVTIHDAQGRMLVDDAGKPLQAVTATDGSYKLDAALPAENLILRVKLWQGGSLQAMLAKDWPVLQAMMGASDPPPLDLDTASTLGATYVLDKFVKGDQAVYDKLPAVEAQKLQERMAAARGLVTGVPKYEAAELVGLAEQVRQGAEAVDEALETIEALLLGQAELGNGRQATEVALLDPRTLAKLPDGSWLIGEESIGRIRRVAPDGTISTWADQVQGVVKKNFFGQTALKVSKDGSVLATAASEKRAYRIGADNQPVALPLPAGFAAWSLAEAADGTVYVGEGDTGRAGLVVAIAPGGTLTELPAPGWTRGGPKALAVGKDGKVYALVRGFGSSAIWTLAAGATSWEQMGETFIGGNDADLLAAPDGSLYLAQDGASRVYRYAPDGTRTLVAGGPGSPGEGQLRGPGGMLLEADGALLIADPAATVVWRLTKAGTLTRVAGIQASGAVQGGDGGSLAINAPGGVAFDSQGRMIIAEVAGHALKRYDGKELVQIAGDGQGRSGDGGPALKAQLNSPTAVAVRDDAIFVVDGGNRSIRKIAPDGTISTAVGAGIATAGFIAFGPGFLVPGERCSVFKTAGMALDPAGLPVWASAATNQVVRLQADGQARLIAGHVNGVPGEGADGPAAPGTSLAAPMGVAYGPDGALYFADCANMRVRRLAAPGAESGALETWIGTGVADTLGKLKAGTPTVVAGATRQATAIALPAGLCFDAAGNMYLGELGTRQMALLGLLAPATAGLDLEGVPPTAARVLKVTPAGQVSVVCGPGGKFFTDPEAADALVLPSNMTVDPKGRLVILDAGANLIRFLPAGSY